MAKAGYAVRTSSAVALVAATAKTVIMVLAPASFGVDLKKFRLSFDGTTATATPALIELVSSTNATNSTPGTANTNESSNIVQAYGRSIVTGFTAFSGSTSEPTVLTVVDSFLLTPTGGTLFYDFPLGDTPDTNVSAGIGLRVTAPAVVNVRASMHFERC
jgi:hypothetical protein